MNGDARGLPHRLAPQPVGSGGFLAGAIVCFGMAGGAYYGATTNNTGPVPWELLAGLALLALVGIGFVVAMLRQALHRFSRRAPRVEVDAQPWHPGGKHRLRIVVPDASSLVEVSARLEALDWVSVNPGGRRQHQVPVHTLTLLSLSGAELDNARASGSIDRIVEIAVPAEAARQRWLWGIKVRGIAQPFTAFQEKVFDKLIAHQTRHMDAGVQELVKGELRGRRGAGTPEWEDWFRVEIAGPR